ncbi:MAG: DUF2007 domain-containing protein [Flavobacteriales bacterium]|jgi:hypothetical protein|nr:DUF2007 domain-containing protein [Flavobacteriales bacterium]
MENRVKIYTTDKVYLAEVIKGNLEASGIDTLILNQKDSSYQAFGYIELYVKPEDEERAREIIAETNE